MEWTTLPKEDIIYVDHDDWILENPITLVGTLYIEKETHLCKIGNGKRYASIPYTPWSISINATTTISVKNVISSIGELDVNKNYIWNGDSSYTKGYIITNINSIWVQQIPTDNCLAWVADLYQLKLWDGNVWHDVNTNTHNIQFGLEGGGDGHYYHLSEDEYNGVIRVINDEGGGDDSSGDGVHPPLDDESDNVLFSDGMGGTTVNGIKTNQYKQLDMNYNRIKNAIIDCGAYYG